MAMLEVNNLSIQFGGLHAVDNFQLKIEKGELLWSDRTKRCRKNNRI